MPTVMTSIAETLVSGSLTYGVRLSQTQVAQFERYLNLLADWSARVNLVGDATPEVVIHRHILESIALGAALREREILKPASSVLDVGAGAGFPSVVLKIVWPQIALTLLEATAKKTAFLEALVEELALEGVVIRTGRAETLAHDAELRGAFDMVVARAVAPLPALVELTLPFARVGGRVIAPKGSRADQEVADAARALEVLGGQAFIVPFSVPGPAQKLIAVLKRRETAPEYPRRPGVPARHPL